jgi:glycosyltransferase family protein
MKKTLTYKLKLLVKLLISILTYYYYKNKNRFHVYSIEETVEKLITDKCSMVRFGDGEMGMILGHGIAFQEYDEGLSKRLREILGSNNEKLLVCIPDIFEGLEKYRNKDSKIFWMGHLLTTRKGWESICKNNNYYNAFISRPYNMFLDINAAKIYFEKIISIWNNEDVLLTFYQ